MWETAGDLETGGGLSLTVARGGVRLSAKTVAMDTVGRSRGGDGLAVCDDVDWIRYVLF